MDLTKKPAPAFSGILVALVVFVSLSVSAMFYPLTWDEKAVSDRGDSAMQWGKLVARSLLGIPAPKPDGETGDKVSIKELFTKPVLKASWPGTIGIEGHPQFPIVLSTAGKLLVPDFMPGECRLRFGTVCFFSLAMGAVFFRLRKEFDLTTATFSVVAILLIPRLLAHAQIAAWDSPLTAAWLGVWAFCPRNTVSVRSFAAWGICLGLVLASKFPGWGIVLPIIVWGMYRIAFDQGFRDSFSAHRQRFLFNFFLTTGTAILVFVLLNPPLWRETLDGFRAFFELNTHRDTTRFNISIQFLGELYNLDHSLPWYNTIFWTVVTVPVGLLALFVVGLVSGSFDGVKRGETVFLVLNMSTPLLLRALPGTPVHDGVRLFITAFPFLAILAGIGAASIWKWGRNPRFRIAARATVLAVYLVSAFNVAWYAPQWLSYYNILIGGLPGAVRAGMEPTYYWDAFDREVVDWLNRHVPPDEPFVVGCGSETLRFYNEWGRLKPKILFGDAPPCFLVSPEKSRCRFFVLQRRTGGLPTELLEWSHRHEPVFRKTIRKGGLGPWNLGSVPILEIFDVSAPKKTIRQENHIEQ